METVAVAVAVAVTVTVAVAVTEVAVGVMVGVRKDRTSNDRQGILSGTTRKRRRCVGSTPCPHSKGSPH